jgi:hypothetical protein
MKHLRVLLLILALVLLAGTAFAKTPAPRAQDTAGWQQLARTWRQMSAHWKLKDVSRTRYAALSEDIETAKGILLDMETKKQLKPELRKALEELFQRRYVFIGEQCYQPRSTFFVTDLENHAHIARSRIEDDLSVLLWPPEAAPNITPKQIEELKTRTRQDIAVNLEYLARAAVIQQLIATKRMEAQKRADNDEKVDWDRFQLTSYRYIRGLIEPYTANKLRPSKETMELQKLVLSLTEEPIIQS